MGNELAGTGHWIDKQGDTWTLGSDGLLHTPETAPFTLEQVQKKWGPLKAVRSQPEPECTIFPHCHLENGHAGWCERLTSEEADRNVAESRAASARERQTEHTGQLNLTGHGNPERSVSEEIVLTAHRAHVDVIVTTWHQWHGDVLDPMRAALEAAYPAIRQQVTEEIAAAIKVRQQAAGRAVAYEALALAARIAHDIGRGETP